MVPDHAALSVEELKRRLISVKWDLPDGAVVVGVHQTKTMTVVQYLDKSFIEQVCHA